jgi:hypothetical protein
METQKTNLTKEQKREQRLQRWVSPQGITFRDSKAGKLYQERVRRFIKAFLCEKPDLKWQSFYFINKNLFKKG